MDIHVTPERIVLLDTQVWLFSDIIDLLDCPIVHSLVSNKHLPKHEQPIFSLSVLERAIRNDHVPDGMLPELWLELQVKIGDGITESFLVLYSRDCDH